MPVSLFLSWLKNDQSSYHLLVNTGGFSSFSDCYKAVVGSIGGVAIASSGLAFRVKGFRNGIWS